MNVRTLAVLVLLAACAKQQPAPVAAPAAPATLCVHGVPADACVQCHPELAPQFQARGDWCPEHARPETQCLLCHPELTFEAMPPVPAGADLQHLSRHGEDVPALAPHAAPGKVTIFDFYADWCVPCRAVDRHVLELLGRRTDVAYRRINVVSWDSAVAQRYLRTVEALPYVVVYGKDGAEVRTITGLDLAGLDAALTAGGAQ